MELGVGPRGTVQSIGCIGVVHHEEGDVVGESGLVGMMSKSGILKSGISKSG
jgi:hypothetical protein